MIIPHDQQRSHKPPGLLDPSLTSNDTIRPLEPRVELLVVLDQLAGVSSRIQDQRPANRSPVSEPQCRAAIGVADAVGLAIQEHDT